MKNFEYYKGDHDACVAAWHKFCDICEQNSDDFMANIEFSTWLFREHEDLKLEYTNLDYFRNFRLSDVLSEFRHDIAKNVQNYIDISTNEYIDGFDSWLKEKHKTAD